MICNILSINIISAVMGAIAIYFFCYFNFGVKATWIKSIVYILVFGILNGFVSTFLTHGNDLINIFKPIFLLFLSIFIIRVMLSLKIHQGLIAYFSYTIIMGIGNSLVPLIINMSLNEFTTTNMLENASGVLLVNIFSNLIAFIVTFAIKPLRLFINKMISQKTTLSILFITFLVLTANFGMHFYIKIFNITAFIIISILSIIYCIYVIVVSANLIKQETAKLELEQQKFYNESLNATLFNLRRFKHDWNNTLTVINSMLAMNKINDAKLYLSEIINQSLEENDIAIYSIKNAGLFGIISSKLNLAHELKVAIELSVIGEVENIPGIKVSELCEIIGIFLDNAIEESVKSKDTIKINVFDSDDFVEISISNGCTDIPDMKKIYEAGFSSKGEGRGMGLAIVHKILSKNKRVLHTSDHEDHTFTQTITIKKEG